MGHGGVDVSMRYCERMASHFPRISTRPSLVNLQTWSSLCRHPFSRGLIDPWCKMETQGFGIPLISHRKSPGERPPPRPVRLPDAKLPNSCDLSEG